MFATPQAKIITETPTDQQEGVATVTTYDQHVCYVSSGKRIEMGGRVYCQHEPILLTARQADELRAAGAVLPFGKQPKPAPPLVTVGSVTEIALATALRGRV